MNEETIFTEGLRRADPAERATYLDAACAGDAALRRRVEDLLAAREAGGTFREPPFEPPPTDSGSEAVPPTESAPEV